MNFTYKEMKKDSILAVIPARGGSKRLPRKNILNLRNKPLLEYSIQAALDCDLINNVVVTSEDPEICSIAAKTGVTIIKRPTELAGDNVSNEQVIKHTIEVFSADNYFPEYLVLLQPTSPLRTALHLEQCLQQFINSGMKSVMSVCKVEHHPGKCIRINQSKAEPYTSLEDVEKKSQDLEEIYRQNGAIYALKTSDFLNELKFYQSPCFPFIMKEDDSIDVDSKLDLQFCEFLLSINNMARVNEYVS